MDEPTFDFGPTAVSFTKTFTDKYGIEPGYHAAGGYTAGLLLQRAIELAGSIDQAKVAEQLNKMDVTTLFGRTKFSTDPKEHGLQLGHEMVLAQWQKKTGKIVEEVSWPKAAKTRTSFTDFRRSSPRQRREPSSRRSGA